MSDVRKYLSVLLEGLNPFYEGSDGDLCIWCRKERSQEIETWRQAQEERFHEPDCQLMTAKKSLADFNLTPRQVSGRFAMARFTLIKRDGVKLKGKAVTRKKKYSRSTVQRIIDRRNAPPAPVAANSTATQGLQQEPQKGIRAKDNA